MSLRQVAVLQQRFDELQKNPIVPRALTEFADALLAELRDLENRLAHTERAITAVGPLNPVF